MSSKLILSAYGSHNAAISMYYDGKYTVVEVERWLNSKNIGLANYLPSYNMQLVFDEICEYLLAQTNRSDVDVYITGYMGNIKPKFKYHKHITCDHHTAHAAGAFYQSPYRNALVFTYDGGGDGGFFNVYLADRAGGIRLVDKFNQDLGFAYMILADYLADIKKENLSIGNLVYAGKLMGLCSYGKVREEWLPFFEQFYTRFNYTGDSYLGGAEARISALLELFEGIGVVDFDIETSTFEGQFAWDIAATTQKAFENQFFKFVEPYLKQYNLPVALSGGCALNVLLNTLLLEQRDGQVYVPPNTNDCGISVGALLWHLAPETQVDLTYSGLPILDAHMFSEYVEDRQFAIIPDIHATDIARFIADGNILGVIQGNSEHGSRALGNRSIICNPIEGMKDTLNQKVKNREWYRPFAPIVRVEDVHTYFDFAGTESRHMVFVAKVKDEWKSVLPAITHEDGTGRLQTVTRQQNELIYDIITEFNKMSGHGVILNTSFNVNGKPILTKLSDALHILSHSKLDAVYYKGYLIFRSGEARNFKKYRKNEKADNQKLSDDATIYLSIFDSKLTANITKYKAQIKALTKVKGTKITIIAEDTASASAFRELGIPIQLHLVGTNRHYYAKSIQAALPALSTTIKLSPMIKLLWAKEAMKENLHNTKNHIFIDLLACAGMNLVSMVENALVNINSDLQDSGTSLVSAVRSLDDDSNFNSDFYQAKYNTIPDTVYTPHLIAGQDEDLDWLFTNYEGIMNRYVPLNKIGTESDYLTVSMMENNNRYRPLFI